MIELVPFRSMCAAIVDDAANPLVLPDSKICPTTEPGEMIRYSGERLDGTKVATRGVSVSIKSLVKAPSNKPQYTGWVGKQTLEKTLVKPDTVRRISSSSVRLGGASWGRAASWMLASISPSQSKKRPSVNLGFCGSSAKAAGEIGNATIKIASAKRRTIKRFHLAIAESAMETRLRR